MTFSYHFNLCKPCKIPPTYGNTISTCRNKTGIVIIPFLFVEVGGLYPAYQVLGGGSCYHLGGGVEDKFMNWSPIGKDSPY